jgi:hypothetical protein
MRDLFISWLAFSITMSMGALMAPSRPIPPPWLIDNFDRLVPIFCGDQWVWDSVPPGQPESSHTEEECGVILIPNLKLPVDFFR